MNEKNYSFYINSNLKAADIFATALLVILLLGNLIVAPIFLGPWWLLILYALEMIPPLVVLWSMGLKPYQAIGATLGGVLSTPCSISILATNFLFPGDKNVS